MSTEVDKRVVEMQFKNDQFEKGAKTSIETVEKLKKSLDFNGAADGLKNLGNNVKSISLDSLAASVDQISNRFSTMGIIGMTALQNITNSAINAGKQLLESLTIAPIKDGFREYELQMDSTQTIMASTGESLETVTRYLDELNTYADKTIYSFSDMTANIGKFTNAGVNLKSAVKAIQGISNEAAVSGANAQQASHAMYNFAQALSAGYVKLIDWKSIENANMATKEFKEQLIQTAVEMGTLTDAGDGMYSTLNGHTMNAVRDFNDSLKDEWMTTEVLVNTLNRYSDETTEIGKKSFAAAQDVKTFSQLMDTLKEAAGSGWAQTWKIIIGDFEEAKGLFTAMSNEFGGIIDSMAKARNQLLEGALGDSSKFVKEKWRDTFNTIKNYEKDFVDVSLWTKLDKSFGFSEGYKKGVLELAVAAGTLTKTEDGLYDTGKHLISVNSSLDEWNASLEDGWLKSSIACDGLSKSVDEADKKMVRMSGRELLVESLKNIWNTIKTIAGSIKAAFRQIFPAFTSEQLYKLIEGFKNLTESLKPSPIVADRLRRTFQGLFAIIDIIIQPIKFFANIIIDLIKFFSPAAGGALELTAGIGDLLTNLDKAIKDSEVFEKALDSLRKTFKPVGDAIKDIFGFIKDLLVSLLDWDNSNKDLSKSIEDVTKKSEGFAKVLEVLKNIAGAFYAVGSAIGNFFKKIWEGIKWVWNLPFVQTQVKRFGSAFKEVGKNIVDSFGPTSKAFSEFMERVKSLDGFSLKNVWTVINDFSKNVAGTFFSGFFSSLKPLGKAVLDFFGDLFGGISKKLNANEKLKPLGTIADKIKDFFKAFGSTESGENGLSNLGKFGDGLQNVSNTFGSIADTMGPTLERIGDFVSKNFPAILTTLTGVVIVKGIKKLSDLGEAFVTGVKAIASGFQGVGQMLTGVSQVITNFAKLEKAAAFSTYASSILTIAKAIATLVVALVVLTFFNTDKLWESLKVLGTLVGIMAGVMALMAVMVNKFSFDPTQMLSMVAVISAFAGAMMTLSFAIIIMGMAKNVTQSLDAFSAMILMFLGIVITLGLAFKNNDKSIRNAATAIAAFGASILLMAVALSIVDGLKHVVQDLLVFAGMVIGLVLVVKALGKNQNSTMAAAAALVAFAAAILIISAAFMIMENLKNPLTSLIIFAGMMLGLVLFVALVGKMKNDAKVSAGVLLSFAGAILIIAAAMAIIGLMKPESIIMSLISITIIMTMLIVVIAVSAAAGKEAHKAGALLIGLGASLLMIAFAMTILGGMSVSDMKKALSCIVVLGIIFAAIIAVSILAGQHAMKAGIMLLAMSGALLILSGVVWILGSLDPAVAKRGVAAVSTLILVMAVLIALGHEAQASVKYILAITACIAILGIMVAALSMIEPDRLAVATASLDSLMLCFALLIQVSKGAEKVNASIFILVAAVAAMGLLVYGLSMLVEDGDKFESISIGLSALTVALAAAMKLISTIDPSKVSLGGTAKISAAMDILLGMVVAVIAGIGGIVNAIDEFTGGGATAAIEKGLEILNSIASGIGEMIGNFIGAIGEGISNHFEAIGENMSKFAEKLKPFFEVMSNIPDGVEGKMSQVVAAIGVLTASDFIYSLTQFFGGKSFEEYGNEMAKFGGGLKAFLESINDLSDDDLSKIDIASKATKALSEAFSAMPTEGGFLEVIMGKSMGGEKFGEEVVAFGEMLKNFKDSVKDLTKEDIAAIKRAADAAKALTDLANSIPNSGGLLGKIVGENDMDTFGSQLSAFGSSLVSFSSSVKGLKKGDTDKWKQIAEGMGPLMDLSSKIENAGGLLGMIAGNDDLGELGDQLTKFGNGLADYSEAIKPITSSHILKWKQITNGIGPLVDLGNKLQNDGGWLDVFLGGNGLDDLGNQLSYFGGGLLQYGQAVEKITTKQLNAIVLATGAARSLVELANNLHMDNDGSIFDVFTGGNGLDDFGNQLGTFGAGLAAFGNNIGEFDEGTKNRIIYACNAASGLVSLGNQTNADGLSTFISTFSTDTGTNSFTSIASEFATGISMMGTILTTFPMNAPSTIGAAAKAAIALSGIGDAESGMKAFLDLPTDGFSGKAKEFGEGMNAFASNLSDFSESYANNIIYAAKAAVGLSIIGNNSDGLSNFVSLSLDNFASQGEKFGKGITSLINNLTKDCSDSDVEAISNAYDVVVGIGDVSNYMANLVVAGEDAFNKFEYFTTLLADRLSKFSDDCKSIVDDRGNIDALLTLVETIESKFKTYAGLYDAQLVQSMVDSIQKVIDVMRNMQTVNQEQVNVFLDSLRNVATSAGNTFVEQMGIAAQGAEKAVKALLTAIKDAVVTNCKMVYDEFGRFCSQIITTIEIALGGPNALQACASVGAGLLNAIVNGFANADRSGLAGTVSSVASDITNAVKNHQSDMESAGWYLMVGLARGIGSGKSLVIAAATDVMVSAIEKAKQAAAMKSPSKVTEEMGGNLDKGLAIGMLKNMRITDKAGEEVVGNALDTMANSINKIASLVNGDLDLSPVITPVIDTSKVAAGISDINNMFSAQQAIKAINTIDGTKEALKIDEDIKELIRLNKAMLSAINSGGNIYLNENLIIGRINRRLGAL